MKCLRWSFSEGQDFETAIGSKQGTLTASVFSQVPIVTIEMVVLSNRADAAFIKSEAGQQKVAHAIAVGIAACVENKEQ